jgi:hypothetical protein
MGKGKMVHIPQRVLSPIDITPEKRIRGEYWEWSKKKIVKFNKTEKQLLQELQEYTRRICKRKKDPVDIIKTIFNAIHTPDASNQNPGKLGIKYAWAKKTTARGIEVFAFRKGDCDEVSFLGMMMLKMIKLPPQIKGVYIVDTVNHAYLAVLIKGKKPEGAFNAFEKDRTFRNRILSRLKIKSSKDVHLVMIDPTVSISAFGFQASPRLIYDIHDERGTVSCYHGALGHQHYNNDKLDEAIKELKISIKLKCDYVEAHVKLAKVYMRKWRLEKDKKWLNVGIKEQQTVIKLAAKQGILNGVEYSKLGDGYYFKKDLEKALKAYKKAVALCPDFKQIAPSEYNKFKEAEDYIPGHIITKMTNVYLELGKRAEAYSHLRKMLNDKKILKKYPEIKELIISNIETVKLDIKIVKKKKVPDRFKSFYK